jgi:hypothetical protein
LRFLSNFLPVIQSFFDLLTFGAILKRLQWMPVLAERA